MNELLTISAAEIARRIRERKISPVDVVEAHIQRIQQVNPKINAVVTTMFEQARAEAQHAAEQLATLQEVPPLFGVPITIKDCFPVAGVRFTAGSWYLRDNIAQDDAEVVKKLRAAGAIILGKTNLPDMCWSAETINPVFGRTNNPHDLKRTAGGSSGGEGAIIAAGGSPLGVGSDIAGSVRIPAVVNGIVSLKPTGGRVSTAGHIPVAPQAISTWNTPGPMARRVEDLALALSVMSETPVQDYRAISLQGRRVTVYTNNMMAPASPRVSEYTMLAAGALASAGMEMVRDNTIPFSRAGFIYGALLHKEADKALRSGLGGGEPYKLMEQIRERHITPSALLFTELNSLFGRVFNLLRFGSHQKLAALRQEILDIMTPGGVIVMPVIPTITPFHGWMWWYALRLPYTFFINALGFPAACVPITFTKDGLTFGVQIIAHPGDDEVALAVAAELERVFGGWQIAEVN